MGPECVSFSLSVVGHDTTVDLFHNPGVCAMAQSGQLSSTLHKLCSIFLGRWIIDLGCTDTMCGEFWLKSICASLGLMALIFCGVTPMHSSYLETVARGQRFTELTYRCRLV